MPRNKPILPERGACPKVGAGEQWEQDYPIFMAIAENIGYDSTVRPDDHDLPALLKHYRNGTGSLDDKVTRVRRKAVTNNCRLRLLKPYYQTNLGMDTAPRPHPSKSRRY